MDVNGVILYGFAGALAVFSAIAYLADRNMRRMIGGLGREKERAHKMEKLVGELDRDVAALKGEISRKVEARSLERILAETVEFIDSHTPAVAVNENRVPVRR